jgi:hypothetical protein
MKFWRWGPAVLMSGLILMGATALAQTLRIIPVPPGVKPQWQAVPEAPQVSFALNIPTDVFRYRSRYYLNWDGMWFESRKIEGPWNRSPRPPRVLAGIPASYFKTVSRGPQSGAPGRPQIPGAFQPPGGPSGTDKRDPFSVPGVAPPPGWTPPSGGGMPGSAPPTEAMPPGWPPGQPGPEGGPPGPEGAPGAGRQVPQAM